MQHYKMGLLAAIVATFCSAVCTSTMAQDLPASANPLGTVELAAAGDIAVKSGGPCCPHKRGNRQHREQQV